MIDKGIRDGYFRSDINREIQVYLFVKQMSLIGEPEMISELKYPISTIVSTIVENLSAVSRLPKGCMNWNIYFIINLMKKQLSHEKEQI